jgi:hypothetical protein
VLAPIDALDWARYTHAYGSAADVPDLLRELCSADPQRRDRAAYKLYGNIFHQGSRYEASAVAAGFLVELVDDPATPDRPLLLQLLTALAIGYDESWLPDGLPIADLRGWLAANPPDLDGVGERLREWMLDDSHAGPVPGTEEERLRLHAYWELETYDQVRLGVPIYHGLLCEADPQTRVAAAYTLAWFPEDAPDTVPFLVAAADDPDEGLAATARVALGLLTEGDNPVLRAGLTDERRVVRWASAVALARRLGPASPPEAVAQLERWAARRETVDVPFLAGDTAGLAARSLRLVSSPGASAPRPARP